MCACVYMCVHSCIVEFSAYTRKTITPAPAVESIPYVKVDPLNNIDANSTEEMKTKLRAACRRDKSVYRAQKYCKEVKFGKYFCNKKWKCWVPTDIKSDGIKFCSGNVSHTCEISTRDRNFTINLVFQKNNTSGENGNMSIPQEIIKEKVAYHLLTK